LNKGEKKGRGSQEQQHQQLIIITIDDPHTQYLIIILDNFES